ncbi:helix-turn-helix domain-containing protein [Vibrio campbellii]|uniref:helix-turn-helix domain-containing protein n=1 Tax=Vibrio campbellii TaxID=680 RepID=UPI0005F0B326|nr:helix-turn-helix domain-containing protein [Vibrio campbellii]
MSNEKIKSFDYLKGSDFTDNLKQLSQCKSYQELAYVYDIPKTTFSTWNTHNRNSHELVVRTHLRTGIPIHELILPKDYALTDLHHSFWKSSSQLKKENASSNSEPKNVHLDVVAITSFSLTNGNLVDNETLVFDKDYLTKLGALNVMSLEQDGTTFIIDKDVQQAVSGTYLVDMDGLLSLNEIQRLPGKKLAISFNGSTLTVEEDEVRVVGRVVLVMEKK